jgi:hypothetical protein
MRKFTISHQLNFPPPIPRRSRIAFVARPATREGLRSGRGDSFLIAPENIRNTDK